MKKIIFIVLFFIAAGNSFGQQVTFQKAYGGGQEQGYSIVTTANGGYIVAGNTHAYGTGNGDVYLIRMDSLGNILWSKAFGLYGHDMGTSVSQTSDGCFIVTGYTDSWYGYDTYYVIKIDINGNELWAANVLGGDRATSIQQTSDMGYIIAGHSAGAGGPDMCLTKLDSSGLSLWSKAYSGSGSEAANYVQQTTDGGYIITGFTNSYSTGDHDVYLIKSDSAGNLTWSKTFGGSLEDNGFAVQQTTDGGYIITGSTNSFGAGYYDAYLIKTDSAGDALWTKTYGGFSNDWGSSIRQTVDGGYIICGLTGSFGAGDYDAYLIKIDSAGNLQWSKAFGDSAQDRALSIRQAPDGGYIIAGYTQSFGAGYEDIYVIKTDSNGNSGCNEINAATIQFSPATQVNSVTAAVFSGFASNYFVNSMVGSGVIETTICTIVGINSGPVLPGGEGIAIAPNPATNNFTITFPNTINKGVIEIYNVMGEKIFEENIINVSQKEVQLENMEAGIYFVKVRDGEKESCKKLVIE